MYQVKRAFRTKGPVLRQNQCGDMEYLTFPLLEETGCVKHLFTTRLGGVSQGIFATMNLGFHRGDQPEHVLENYKIVGKALGVSVEDMVTSKQTHTTNIRRVTSKDRGKGIMHPLDYDNVDGLITNEEGIVLATSYADCVPLYFVDPVNKAIGLAHSGWRGTVAQMGLCMVEKMKEQFGSCPKDLVAAIGPSICQECYEVSDDVAEQFSETFEGADDRLLYPAGEGHYRLNLWEANKRVMLDAGVRPEHLQITDLCTCCNPQNLFSHRYSKGRRGNLGAFLMLRAE